MAIFDWLQTGKGGPVSMKCRSCGDRIATEGRLVQQTADRHQCRKNTKNSAR
jgi:hypothetical protein